MRPFLSLLTIFASLSLPAAALAEEPTGAPRSSAAGESDDSPHVRFDLMGGVMGGGAGSAHVSAGALVPAMKLDLGVQLSDHAALYGRVEGGTLLLLNEGAAYLVGEWSPTRLLSVGTGVGYEGMSLAWIGGCEGPSCIRNSWAGISAPLLLALDLGRSRSQAEHGVSLRIELVGAAGYEVATGTWGGHGFLGVGGTWR